MGAKRSSSATSAPRGLPGAVATEFPASVKEPGVAERIRKFYREVAIPAESSSVRGVLAAYDRIDILVNNAFDPTSDRSEGQVF